MGRSAEMWSDVRSAAARVVRRVDPVVLFGLGALVMAVLFGALAVTVLGDTPLEDLGLGSPGAPSPEWGDRPGGGDVAPGAGDGVADGPSSPVHERGASTTSPSPAAGTDGSADGGPWPVASGPTTSRPGPGTTTSPPDPATATSATTAPLTTPTTTPSTTPPLDQGLFGPLLDLLRPGG